MHMTKRFVREALDFSKDVRLAEFFGVGRAAVSAWADDKPIPLARQWQARALRPDLFGPSPASEPMERVA